MRTLVTGLAFLLVPFALALAQSNPSNAATTDNPMAGYNRKVYAGVKKIMLRTAEKMPEENYSFKPTEGVRSFGQILGHVADSQYYFCSAALGEKKASLQIEKTKTSKADLMAALNDAFAYCDKAYDNMTDASGAARVMFMGGETPKLGVLTTNSLHTIEHYGNLVTYLRMKNIVPPTSEPGFMESTEKKPSEKK